MPPGANTFPFCAGGGGGAGGSGQDGYADITPGSLRGGNGGIGIFSTLSGANVAYAGGGGGARNNGGDPVTANAAMGQGGGGYALYSDGSPWLGTPYGGGNGSVTGPGGLGLEANTGMVNTGAGGGGAGASPYLGGTGGSGVIILRYIINPGVNNVYYFANTGQVRLPADVTSIDYLIVAGGGAGGDSNQTNRSGGGGGAGGVRMGSGYVVAPQQLLTAVIGAGGSTNPNSRGANGSNSVLTMLNPFS